MFRVGPAIVDLHFVHELAAAEIRLRLAPDRKEALALAISTAPKWHPPTSHPA